MPPDNPSQEKQDQLDDATLEFASKMFDLTRNGDAKNLEAFLSKGLPPNLRDHKGDSLLMLAAYHGHDAAVNVLLQHKADTGLCDNNGQTPIAGAAFKGHVAVVQCLLDNGADVEGASADLNSLRSLS